MLFYAFQWLNNIPVVVFCRKLKLTKEIKFVKAKRYTSMGTLMPTVVSAWLARMEFDEERVLLLDDGCSA